MTGFRSYVQFKNFNNERICENYSLIGVHTANCILFVFYIVIINYFIKLFITLFKLCNRVSKWSGNDIKNIIIDLRDYNIRF